MLVAQLTDTVCSGLATDSSVRLARSAASAIPACQLQLPMAGSLSLHMSARRQVHSLRIKLACQLGVVGEAHLSFWCQLSEDAHTSPTHSATHCQLAKTMELIVSYRYRERRAHRRVAPPNWISDLTPLRWTMSSDSCGELTESEVSFSGKHRSSPCTVSPHLWVSAQVQQP